MYDIATFLSLVRASVTEENQKLERLRKVEEQVLLIPEKWSSEQRKRVAAEIENCRNEMTSLVEQLLNFPPWHIRHRDKLSAFHESAPYEKSVFVMTKFPEGDSDEDKRLNKLLQLVRKGLEDKGFAARIASGARSHDWLWDEVEIHLLGCAYGVAIVEDRYRPELNPNVAMEWGWMRAMGKRVLFLREEGFRHDRADVVGFRYWSFNWDTPEPGVAKALSEWPA